MNKLGAFVVGIMVGGVVTVKFIGKGLATASKGLAKGSAWIITPSKVKIEGEETMMSPLSVSLFLENPGYVFDVVIFDEASQVKPENAIGSPV